MRFVVRRLGFFVVTLWAAVTLNFLIPRLMPGNAALAMMSRYKGRIQPRALRHLVDVLPRRRQPRGAAGAAVDARARRRDDDSRVPARHAHRARGGVAAGRVPRR